MPKEKWYADGLKFTCTQCGNCCSGPPGFVWTSADERRKIAEHLGMDLEVFNKTYTHRVGNRHSLKEQGQGENLDCIFLETNGGERTCSIYTVRPVQCRTWPFWTENLRSGSAWDSAADGCPGMNQGKHHDFVQIEIARKRKF